MVDQTTSVELTVPPGGITVEFIAQVKEAMSFRNPVAPNAVWNCLGWAIDLHRKHEALRARLKEFADGA